MKKKGQIWIETVTYTLIGLAIIGAMLAVLVPKINQMNDKAVLSQTINSLITLDEQIHEVIFQQGSQREVSITAKKGEYAINSVNETIYFILKDTKLLYSQPNIPIAYDAITILTTEKTSGRYNITLSLDYSPYNITYQSKDFEKVFTSASVPYKLLIQNLGNKQINFEPI